MKRPFYLSRVLLGTLIILGAHFNGYSQVTYNFNYTGSVAYWTVPANVTQVMVDAAGANGGMGNGYLRGGYGGRVVCSLAVTPGTVFYIGVGASGGDAGGAVVGAGGINGGGQGTLNGGGGGGATDFRLSPYAFANVVLYAGGGGGGSSFSTTDNYDMGGDGGGLTGADGWNSNVQGGDVGGYGGNQVSGGLGGQMSGFGRGTSGSQSNGGDGAVPGGGGGGAGYYGGGGGSWSGGGGGSSYTDPVAATLVTHTQGYNPGNGYLTIIVPDMIPAFTNTSPTNIQVCQDATNYDFTALLNVNDTDAGQTETWTVISGPSSGTLSGFPASNPSSNPGPVTATTVGYTPFAGYYGPDAFTIQVNDGLGGTATMTINVTVNPTPVMSPLPNQVLCNGAMSTADTFSSNILTGATYSWSNDNTLIGLGSGTIGDTLFAFMATNGGFTPITGNIQVTPSASGCVGAPQLFTITVNPTPDVLPIANQAVCNGAMSAADTLGSDVTGATFSWTNDNPLTGMAPGTTYDTIFAFTGTNGGSSPIMSNVMVTPMANGCTGTPLTFVITINPTPMLSSTLTAAEICDSTMLTYIPMYATAGTIGSWSRDAVTGISNPAATGTVDTINEVLVDTTVLPVGVTYVYTLTANGCMNTQMVTDTVNPKLLLTSVLTAPSICNGTTFSYVPTSATPGTTFQWNRNPITGISNPGNTNTFNPLEMLTDTTALPVTVTYNYNIIYHACSNEEDVTVMVNPTPMLSSPLTPASVCDSTMFTYYSMSATPGTTYTWSRDTVVGIMNSPAMGSDDTIREVLVNTTTGPLSVTYMDTLHINGCMNTQSVTVSVNPRPMLTSTLTGNACNNTLFTYVSTSATVGTTYAWSRGAVTGITPTSGSGTGDTISETLANSGTSPQVVTYADTLMINGCWNVQNISVTVNPTPKLSSSHTPTAICDSGSFNYTPASATTGASYAWTRRYVPGIDVPAGSGTDNPNEQLINTTNFDATAVYVYTLTINGCSGTDSVKEVVHPTPVLSSSVTATTCSAAPFVYMASSFTPGVSFAWTRAHVNGITPSTGSGGDTIMETLTDTATTAINTIYTYTITVGTCKHTENVTVVVDPAPVTPIISIMPPATLCSNTHYMNFGASSPSPTGVSYIWSAQNANIMATGSNRQNALISFNTAGTAKVILSTNQAVTSCRNTDTFTVAVSSSVSQAPQVIYYNGQFICLQNDSITYQWGYDDATTLDSTLVPGEVNQVYFNNAPDLSNRYYWVLTNHSGCLQKTYYNVPAGITSVNSSEAGIKLYPNPAGPYVNVEITGVEGGTATVEILNMLGQKLGTSEMLDNRATVNTSGLPSGYYLVNCYREGIKIGTAKFIKQ